MWVDQKTTGTVRASESQNRSRNIAGEWPSCLSWFPWPAWLDATPGLSGCASDADFLSFAIVSLSLSHRPVGAALGRHIVRDGVPQDDGRHFGDVVLITQNAE